MRAVHVDSVVWGGMLTPKNSPKKRTASVVAGRGGSRPAEDLDPSEVDPQGHEARAVE